MPRSFLIKNKKQHEKHEKTLQPGEGGSVAAVESPEIEETRDGMANPLGRAGCASPAPQSPTPPGEAEGQEDEYLDVESMDTDDESNFKVADKMQVDARPPSSSPRFSPDPAAEDDRRQNGRSRSGTPQSQPEDLSQKPRASPPPMIANQPSPIRGTVPVAREMRRGKCSPESGHVLRVPGKRALGSPHEYMPGPNLGRSPPEQHSLSLKYSDPRFWMAGLPGIPPYLPALPQLFPVTSGASLPGQFHVLPARMDSPPGVSPPGYSAFRLSQDLPYPYPTQHAGRPTYMPFQNRFFPYPRPGQATPSPAPSVLSVPRPVSSHSNRAAEPERQQPQHPERKESKAHSPLNWLLDTPYNLSTKSSAQTPLEKAGNPSVIKRQTDPPRYQCEACNKSYATFSGLSKHKQFHCESQIKKEFSCKYCDKTYTSLGALKMHIRTHTLPCKCQICGKAFSRPWLLQGHVRTHTGEKPFTCPHCGRAFADRSNLRAHLQTHSDVKKYSCKTCSKTFSRMSLLLKHEDGSCPGLRTGLSVIPVN